MHHNLSKPHICFLFTIWSDKCVDLGNLNVIQLFDSQFNHWFVSTLVYNKNKSVVVLNFLHGRFSCKRVFYQSILVQFVNPTNAPAWVLWASCKLQGFRSSKMNRGSDLATLFVMLNISPFTYGLLIENVYDS